MRRTARERHDPSLNSMRLLEIYREIGNINVVEKD